MYNRRFSNALRLGYRSGLEIKNKDFLVKQGVKVKYEELKIEWEDLMYRIYTPDFVLPNGIIVETKGRFTAEDRRKHLCVKLQHPKLDIRFVFESSRRKLSKGAKTSYGQWCEKNKFMYHDRIIPEDWLYERGKDMHPDLIPFPLKKVKRK
tara:strand:+ start:293 stop:745 length:453 start_codon:yes stop_codon:yes gene_type:complete